jgi:hypothetical protein
MLRFITRRRRIEDARVDRFLHAIELSGRYSVNPDWELQPVPDEQPTVPVDWRTDTAAMPVILLAGTPLL